MAEDNQDHQLSAARSQEKANADNAAQLIRKKLDELYANEPDAKKEIQEAKSTTKPRSKHQQYMYDLSASGKSLAEIQTAWHRYYEALPDKEKHEVWSEFYEQNQPPSPRPAARQQVHNVELPPDAAEPVKKHKNHRPRDIRSVADVKQQLLSKASSGGKLKAKHHIQSLIFGFGLGSVVLLVFLFSFFNERFIAPFITPSRQVSSTPIINDPGSGSVGPESEIIIPKINVEIPVVYDEPSVEERAIQAALQRGVVHYATTPNPGEKGNVVIFGHSSNNIFNPGKYKFAFVLLSRLENGDLFYLTKDSKRYVYKVYKKELVKPQQVSVLGTATKPDTATLITCDPPGTSLNRLVVIGEQISPGTNSNKSSTASKSDKQPSIIPSNAPSLWQRFKTWLTS